MIDDREADGVADEWRARTPMLAGLGLVAGFVFWLLIARHSDLTALRASAASFVLIGAMSFGFVVERARWRAAAMFAIGCGLVAALILYWNGPSDRWGSSEGWRVVALGLAIGIAAPLFAAWDGRRPVRWDYVRVHDHAWTNAVLFAAGWAFVGVVLLLTFLLSELFKLIGIEWIRDLMRSEWFPSMLVGTAYGTALGLLREQGRVVGTLQRVVMIVLGVLAPVFALGLAAFLIALPVMGFDALWDGWASAAGLMLGCAAAALILANAVIGNRAEDEARNPVLRLGAMLLAIVILPLCVLASVAIGMRIGQYGFTPDRLWALTFAVIASAYGVAYLGSVVLGRMRWAERVRPANLRLAIGTCIVALVLATPLPSFNSISTRDQIARLESGRTPVEQFDFAALAFDFGEPGRAAVRRLATSNDADIRAAAERAVKATNRYELRSPRAIDDETRAQIRQNLRVIPDDPVFRRQVEGVLNGRTFCERACVATASGDGFVLVYALGDETSSVARLGMSGAQRFGRETGNVPLTPQSRVELRPVERRQVFVDGQPVGDAFE